MIIGSHNSWTYLPPKQWWLRPFAFMARCQSASITEQYEKYGVKCFDLRILYDDKGNLSVAHGKFKYKISQSELLTQLEWLNEKENCFVRVLNDARNKAAYTASSVEYFKILCHTIEKAYPNIWFFCGRNLYNWEVDYSFSPPPNAPQSLIPALSVGNSSTVAQASEPTCHEDHASVSSPKIIDDWFPWVYAKLNNHSILSKGTDKDILLIDFVNIR